MVSVDPEVLDLSMASNSDGKSTAKSVSDIDNNHARGMKLPVKLPDSDEPINDIECTGNATSHDDQLNTLLNTRQTIAKGKPLHPVAGSRTDPCLPIQKTMDNITVTLLKSELWKDFNQLTTEMIINRTGRRMFPHIAFSVTGLDPSENYNIMLEISRADRMRYRYGQDRWFPVSPSAVFDKVNNLIPHPTSPQSGVLWMQHNLTFLNVKLTNSDGSEEHVRLHSMHKYVTKIIIQNLNAVLKPRPIVIRLPETAFIAVTAYQNQAITRLKIHNNPFARGFKKRFMFDENKKDDNMHVVNSMESSGSLSSPTIEDESPSCEHKCVDMRCSDSERKNNKKYVKQITDMIPILPAGHAQPYNLDPATRTILIDHLPFGAPLFPRMSCMEMTSCLPYYTGHFPITHMCNVLAQPKQKRARRNNKSNNTPFNFELCCNYTCTDWPQQVDCSIQSIYS